MDKGIVFNENTGPVSIYSEKRIERCSILGKFIEIIASSDPDPIDLKREPVEIDVKISFNDLSTQKWIVEEYVDNSLLIDTSITELNKVINGGSTKLKRQMKLFYKTSLSNFNILKFPEDLPKLRQHSDNIVANVLKCVKDLIISSSDLKSGYYIEDIEFGAMLITSYSIIECIVLENPNDHN